VALGCFRDGKHAIGHLAGHSGASNVFVEQFTQRAQCDIHLEAELLVVHDLNLLLACLGGIKGRENSEEVIEGRLSFNLSDLISFAF
jgi:hypothetical protein